MDFEFIRLLEELKNDKLGASLSADFDNKVMRAVEQLPTRVRARRPKTFSDVVIRVKEILSIFSLAPAPLRAVSFAFMSAAAIFIIAIVAPRRGRLVLFEVEMPRAVSVALTGDFNGWELPGIELARDKNGRWSRKLKLPPGRYRYALVVDDKLMPDPSAGEFVPDGFGAQNAVLDTERPALRM